MSKKLLSTFKHGALTVPIAAVSIGILWACQGEPQSNDASSQSHTQHGFTITVQKVQAGPDGTQLFVELANEGIEAVYFYDVNTEIWQGEKRYEPQRIFGSANELPSKISPGSRAEGVILFPRMAEGGEEAVIRFQRPGDETNNKAWSPVEFRWSLPLPSTSKSAIETMVDFRSSDSQRRIAIIKADDLAGLSANWNRFIEVSAWRSIKVSIGIICDSLQEDDEGYFDWLRARKQSGVVEFWVHGWDHQRLGEGRGVSEFNGSGYEYQKKHLTDSQELIRKILGKSLVALGTPWNEFDRDTVRVVNEDPDLRLFFGHKEGVFDSGKVVVRMFQSEADGTGKPNFETFKKLYESKKNRLEVMALQFHPLGFDERGFTEYERMLDFLLQEGWTFLLPHEYLDRLDE